MIYLQYNTDPSDLDQAQTKHYYVTQSRDIKSLNTNNLPPALTVNVSDARLEDEQGE